MSRVASFNHDRRRLRGRPVFLAIAAVGLVLWLPSLLRQPVNEDSPRWRQGFQGSFADGWRIEIGTWSPKVFRPIISPPPHLDCDFVIRSRPGEPTSRYLVHPPLASGSVAELRADAALGSDGPGRLWLLDNAGRVIFALDVRTGDYWSSAIPKDPWHEPPGYSPGWSLARQARDWPYTTGEIWDAHTPEWAAYLPDWAAPDRGVRLARLPTWVYEDEEEDLPASDAAPGG